MDGLTVLVEAKKEYLAQLCCIMCPHMITVFENLYIESNNISKGKKLLVQYQKLLKEVPNWNNHMVHQHSEKISNSCGWFSDLLAAVFVSYVKILSSIRINSENKKISVKLPSNDVFIHGCFTNAAKELYKDPYVYHEEMSEYDRDANLTRRFITCIENTVKEMIPMQEILKTYISHKNEIEVENHKEEDMEDPDVVEEEEQQQPLSQEEEVPSQEEVPASAPAIDPTSSITSLLPPVESEVKSIPVQSHPQPNEDDEREDLFPDAKI